MNRRAIHATIGIAIAMLIIANMIVATQKVHLKLQLDKANHTIEIQHAQLQVLQPDAICP